VTKHSRTIVGDTVKQQHPVAVGRSRANFRSTQFDPIGRTHIEIPFGPGSSTEHALGFVRTEVGVFCRVQDAGPNQFAHDRSADRSKRNDDQGELDNQAGASGQGNASRETTRREHRKFREPDAIER